MESFKTATETSSRIMQEIATRNGLSTPATSLQNSGDRENLRNKLYLADCIDLVKKLNNWANLPPLSELDLASRAKDWQDALEVEVPRLRIWDVLARADRDHISTFPINKYEMSSAWRAIADEDRELKAKIRAALKFTNPVEVCEDANTHINLSGEVVIYSLFTDTDESVPCQRCRFDDYEKWRKSQASLYGEIQPLTKLQKFTENRIYANLKNPVEILNRAVNEVSAAMVKVVGTSEYNHLHGFWLTLVHALGYVRAHEEV